MICPLFAGQAAPDSGTADVDATYVLVEDVDAIEEKPEDEATEGEPSDEVEE